MTEGLTDKMRCERCGLDWLRFREIPNGVRCSMVVAEHSWVVPVSAVIEAIDALDAVPVEDAYAEAFCDGVHSALGTVRALFAVEEETHGA